MASKKPKPKKLGKKPSRSASVETKENWLKRRDAILSQNKKSIRDWESKHKRSKELDKKIYG